MRRLPPGPFIRSLVLTSVVVWIVPRGLVTAGVRVASAVSGVPMGVHPLVPLILALAVSGIVLLDVTASRERVFVQNLGVSPLTILGISFATAVLCEVLVGVTSALSAVIGVGG